MGPEKNTPLTYKWPLGLEKKVVFPTLDLDRFALHRHLEMTCCSNGSTALNGQDVGTHLLQTALDLEPKAWM